MEIIKLAQRVGQLEAIVNGLLEAKFVEGDIWTDVVRKQAIDAMKESTFYGEEYREKENE